MISALSGDAGALRAFPTRLPKTILLLCNASGIEPFVRKKFLLFMKAKNIVSTKVNGLSDAQRQKLYTQWLHMSILCV